MNRTDGHTYHVCAQKIIGRVSSIVSKIYRFSWQNTNNVRVVAFHFVPHLMEWMFDLTMMYNIGRLMPMPSIVIYIFSVSRANKLYGNRNDVHK